MRPGRAPPASAGFDGAAYFYRLCPVCNVCDWTYETVDREARQAVGILHTSIDPAAVVSSADVL